jgi:hypothetical protein
MCLAQWCCHCWEHYWLAFSVVITFCWMSSVSWNLHPFQADFIFGDRSLSELSQEIRVGVQFWYLIFGLETAWQRVPSELEHCHGGTSSWVKSSVQAFFYAQLLVTASVFRHNKLSGLFGLTKWIQSKQYPWYQRKWWALSSFVILTCMLSYVMGMSAISIAYFVIDSMYHVK